MAKQAQPTDVDEDDERDDEDDATPKDDKVDDRSATDQAQDAGNTHTHSHTPGAPHQAPGRVLAETLRVNSVDSTPRLRRSTLAIMA
jgi:hypothetical protein